MGKYRVWCEQWASETTASSIEASSSQDAAERYAERCFDEPFDSCTCHVMTPTGKRKLIRVDVDCEPTFEGWDVTPDEEQA